MAHGAIFRGLPFLLLVTAATVSWGQAHEPFRPTRDEVSASYARADLLRGEFESRAFMLQLQPNWFDEGRQFWYRRDFPQSRGNQRPERRYQFVRVQTSSGAKSPLFDHERIAAELANRLDRAVSPTNLPFNTVEMRDGSMILEVSGKRWSVDLATYAWTDIPPREARPNEAPRPWVQNLHPPERRRQNAPDGRASAWIDAHNVRVRMEGGEEFALTDFGSEKEYFSRLHWSPDSKRLVAIQVAAGDRKPVHLIESSPADGGRARLHTRVYDLPGDRVDTFEVWILDVEGRKASKVDAETVDYWNMPSVRWRKDGRHFTYEKLDRGYGRMRIIEVDSVTGKTRTIVDDDPETFYDITSHTVRYFEGSDEILFRSERDGWGHLYLFDRDGNAKQITRGDWVVRGLEHVDEAKREIVFRASGMKPGEDPYLIRLYRIGFDGRGMVELTPGHGTHTVQFSPDRTYYVDTYSRVDAPQVHELRRASDGSLVTLLERADISELEKIGWKPPQVFTAKGRDGKADIWGIVFRPQNMVPGKKYPVVEDIYAGPHDSHVPKTFSAWRNSNTLSELGFVMVHIDGMGTRNRSKAFHDLAYKNLADSGFPDRILWMRALAAQDPRLDLDRVGIFGTSAGGQSSTAALLFHPDFYKVAVSSCGCHDNRMDKIWWNEQWMGLMGPHYEEQSNITNAHRLRGRLMLMVGEMDRNVPPESTYRLVDALIKANREFEFVLLPGLDHTGGGPYGERKRRDFLIRHLHGAETPEWNTSPPRRR
jgi:dipeptidyl aminopeptidase/acylaminoacyl peptidase